ncbi:MAG TPA: sterol carrier family protein [Mycobacteriales bacterium]|nr:sterol carrier family protein [Mycobacteriales bacterium]
MATKLAAVRAAYAAQQRNVVEWLFALPLEAWERPSRLGAWTVRELGFHVTDMTGIVGRALAADRPRDKALTIAAYTSAWPAAATEIAARDREGAAGLAPDDVLANAARARADLLAALDAVAGDPVVQARRGPLRLSDLMVTRVNELVVHSLDLSASLPELEPIALDRAALGVATRMLTGILAERAPGHSVELRVPPYAAVQCVTGPRHTRGTPPNVVEVDAMTWVELATGRMQWTAALGEGRVHASGERADLSTYLPVLS